MFVSLPPRCFSVCVINRLATNLKPAEEFSAYCRSGEKTYVETNVLFIFILYFMFNCAVLEILENQDCEHTNLKAHYGTENNQSKRFRIETRRNEHKYTTQTSLRTHVA